jgi:hypothetical protein
MPKFELEPIDRSNRFKKKNYFSSESHPTNLGNNEGKALSYKRRVNGEKILPLRLHYMEPEKFTRKYIKPGIEDYVFTENELRDGHIKFLLSNRWTIKKIVAKLDVAYRVVWYIASGRKKREIYPIKPDWFDRENIS